jgi:hypothetical protein
MLDDVALTAELEAAKAANLDVRRPVAVFGGRDRERDADNRCEGWRRLLCELPGP